MTDFFARVAVVAVVVGLSLLWLVSSLLNSIL